MTSVNTHGIVNRRRYGEAWRVRPLGPAPVGLRWVKNAGAWVLTDSGAPEAAMVRSGGAVVLDDTRTAGTVRPINIPPHHVVFT